VFYSNHQSLPGPSSVIFSSRQLTSCKPNFRDVIFFQVVHFFFLNTFAGVLNPVIHNIFNFRIQKHITILPADTLLKRVRHRVIHNIFNFRIQKHITILRADTLLKRFSEIKIYRPSEKHNDRGR